MEIEFDDAKDAINVAKHGISLIASMELLESDHDIRIDDRKKYGEDRMVATGHIGGASISVSTPYATTSFA